MILSPLHAKGFHLVTGQRPAAEPEGEQGPRPALDRDTLPKALAALVNRAAPGRLILAPLHGTPGQRPAAEPQSEPGRRWTWTPSRSPSPPRLVRGPGVGLGGLPPGDRPATSDRAPGRTLPALDLDTLPKTLAALVNFPEPKPAAAGSRPRFRLGGRLHLDRPAAEPQDEQGPRSALDRDTLPKALAALDTLPEPGRLILAPLHAKGFHLVTGQRSRAPGRTLPALDLTPSRRPSRRWSTCRSPPG